MIERIARRAGGFASTTAIRWLSGTREHVPDIDIPVSKKRGAVRRLGAPLTKGAAMTGAFVLVSSSKPVRNGVAIGLRKVTDLLRPDSSSQHAPAPSARSNGSHPNNGHSNGSGALSEKTRTELYEMAKKKDIQGRSGMTKGELLKALNGNGT